MHLAERGFPPSFTRPPASYTGVFIDVDLESDDDDTLNGLTDPDKPPSATADLSLKKIKVLERTHNRLNAALTRVNGRDDKEGTR